MKTRFLMALSVAGAIITLAYPLYVAASPSNSTAVPRAIPNYFYLTPQQLSDLLTKRVKETNKNMPIRDLRVYSRQYEEDCDHVFFTFRSNQGLFLGIGELRESRVQDGQVVARTLIREIDRRKPFEIQYAFSACFPSLAGAVNDPSITWIDVIESDGRLTRIPVFEGFFSRVLDHGMNIHKFQNVRVEAANRNNQLVAAISGSDLYPKPR